MEKNTTNSNSNWSIQDFIQDIETISQGNEVLSNQNETNLNTEPKSTELTATTPESKVDSNLVTESSTNFNVQSNSEVPENFSETDGGNELLKEMFFGILEDNGSTANDPDEFNISNAEDFVREVNDFYKYKYEDSAPQYNSDIARQMDEFVAQGGNEKDFINAISEVRNYINLETVSYDTDSQRRAILTDHFKVSTLFKDARIQKEVNAIMESDDVDQFIANEALPELKEYAEQEIAGLRKQQFDEQQERYRIYENWKSNTATAIDQSSEIFEGVKLTKASKEGFKRFYLEQGKDGKSDWQRLASSQKHSNYIDLQAAYMIFLQTSGTSVKETVESNHTKTVNDLLNRTNRTNNQLVNGVKAKTAGDITTRVQEYAKNFIS